MPVTVLSLADAVRGLPSAALPRAQELRALCGTAFPAPGTLRLHGAPWAFASNGAHALAFAMPHGYACRGLAPEEDFSPSHAEQLKALFAQSDPGAATINLGALRAWCGPVARATRCPNRCVQCSKCKGRGCARCREYNSETQQQHSGRVFVTCFGSRAACLSCDPAHDGYTPPPPRPGRVFEHEPASWARNDLARLLAPLGLVWDHVNLSAFESDYRLHLIAPQLVILLCGRVLDSSTPLFPDP